MYDLTRPWCRGRVEAGGSPQGPRSTEADHNHGAPPAVSSRPERSPGLDSPHQRSRVMDKLPAFVGIDVSKHRLDIHLRPSGEGFAVDHGEEEVAALVARLAALAPALVVLEATGGLEVRPAAAWRSAPRRPGGPPRGGLEVRPAAAWRSAPRRPGGPPRGGLEVRPAAAWRSAPRRPGGP